ncbi:MAG: phosphoribosylamine--glycine ligase [Chloroflexota bacterium]
MKVLVIGSGGREHTLAWKLAQSPQVQHIFVAPGNAGTEWSAESGRASSVNVAVKADDIATLLDFAQQNAIDLTIVGPEAPLSAGIVDTFMAAGLKIFGPAQSAAQLESSKAFAKAFMQRHNIPTAAYQAFDTFEEAAEFIDEFAISGRSVVVKADGLAAGKGVIVCETVEEALQALHRVLIDHEFGSAGSQVVIEERLSGPEVSVLAFCDGQDVLLMPPARDHKRVFDDDQGPNTGGMGAYSDMHQPLIEPALLQEIKDRVLLPTVRGMAAEGTLFRGILYAGLMLTPDGFKVLEFNTRFGDPETQVILPLLKADLVEILLACIEGSLSEYPQSNSLWRDSACAAVVLTAPGYPGEYPKGLLITGLECVPQAEVFHAGTTRDSQNQVVTAGGRVLAVSACGETLTQALNQAYTGVEQIHFEGMHYRHDIGRPALTEAKDHLLEAQGNVYRLAGVDIDASNRAKSLMAAAVKSTYTPAVLGGIGAFGGLYDAGQLQQMNAPVLVASTDGVGTKMKVASRFGQWDTIGHDLVNHCINDILVQGARPLFFLDYVASSAIAPEQIAAIVGGIAAACRAVGCVLLGGETAEMPGVYVGGEFDLVGTIIGVVERAKIIDGSRIQPGDLIVGLPSSGLHTNGYSLARRALSELDWTIFRPELDCTIGEALLAVHRSYIPEIERLQSAGIDIKGLAHITGGGLIENPPRIFPDGTGAILHKGTWPIPTIFSLIQTTGDVSEAEMYRVFNMGLGMLAIIPPDQKALLSGDVYLVGEIIAGSGVAIQ